MDGGGAPRANAAQLAARNIKQLKGRRTGPGSRASPGPSSPASFGTSQPAPSFGQFQPPGGPQNGGGFNFSTPANGDFNNPFANNNGSAPMSENDERRDPAEEPFGKRGRHVNGGDGNSVPLFAPMPSNPFAGAPNGQQSSSGFGGFGQSNGVNGTQSPAATPAPIFSGFGQSQSTAPTFNPTPQKAASFDFNFGATPSATPQPQSTSASFTFGQTQAQTPKQPKSTGFQFGATNVSSTPASNLFGTSQAPSTNLFGSKPSTPALPAADLFAKKESSPAPSNNLFGSTSQTPSSNLFGSAPAPSNPFGSRDSSPAPAPSTNLFGSQPAAANMFASSVPSGSNLFSQKSSKPAQTSGAHNPFASLSTPASTSFSSSAPAPNNLFGSRDPSPALSANGSTQAPIEPSTQASSSTLFGTKAQDTPQKPASTTPFGSTSQPSPLFGAPKPQSTPLFGSLGQTPNASSTPEKTSIQPALSSTLFSSTPKSNNNDLFGNLNKPVDRSVTDPESAVAPSFGNATATPPTSTLFGQQTSSGTSTISETASPSPSFPPPTTSTASPAKPVFSFGVTAATPPPAPQPAKASLFSSQTASEPSTGFLSTSQASAQSTSSQQAKQSTSSKTHEPGSIGESVERIRNFKPAERPTHDGTQFGDLPIPRQIPDELIKEFVPQGFTEDQKQEFYCAYRLRALNKAMSNYFAELQSSADPSNAIYYYEEQRKVLMDQIRSRKSKTSQTFVPPQPTSSPLPGSTQNKRAASPTRNAPAPAEPQSTPTTAGFQLNGTSTNSRPTSNLFSSSVPNLPPPSSSTSTPSSSKSKRKAEDDLDQNNVDQHNKRPMRKIATPKANGATSSPSTSNTANIFRDILDSPSKSPEKSPAKKTAVLPGSPSVAAGETPKANPFGSLFVPKSATKATTPASPAQNLFSAKPEDTPKSSGLTPTTSALFGAKSSDASRPSPAKETTTFSGFKPAASTTAPASTSGGFKMAGFTPSATVNFASQFGKQAAQSEDEQMQKDMDEDMDSDEDPEEWKAQWKAKRQAKKEALKSTSTSGTSAFVFKPSPITNESTGSTKTTLEKTSAGTPQPNKSLFGSSTPAATQGSGLFGSTSVSRTNSPSPAPSASSIFDGQPSGKPPSFGSNIFGHLSKSADDSGKENDADDESEDDADIDADSENKDPNYTPTKDSSSGPGTPAEETGAGIASAKKTNLFNFSSSKTGSVFGGSPSGTSTPGGSLFGRITPKPPSPSSEEKENTKPAGGGLFAGLNKSQNGPVDQTWKPDSPIKFGAATPTSDSKTATPTVNITAATPTKTATTGLFGSLNKTSTPTSAPFSSNLFGGSTTPKPGAAPSVGFNFGGPSTTSSLFPSATTSRATTPGATTDGDSAAEDADAEKHEQISLTSGAGEEDEDIELEVRAKAMQFLPKEDGTSGWETKGLGVLKVLKHKETKNSRVLLRAEPRGNIILNKSILGQFKYEATAKTVKLTTAGEPGKGLETWILQVKTPESAKELAATLEANKAS